jgi:hypothetical protein
MDKVENLRESAAGWHFYSLYRNNPHEWYLKYILGLAPRYTKPPFVLGRAIHVHNETWWKTKDRDKSLDKGWQVIEEERDNLEDSQDYLDISEKYPIMSSAWVDLWDGTDFGNTFDLVETETPYSVRFGPEDSLAFTFRPDLIMEDKDTERKFVFDYKHSSFSPKRFLSIAESSDQVTAYLWGIAKAHPEWNIGGAYIDGVYNRGKVVSSDHYYAYRPTHYIKVFELGLAGTILEVSQKVKALSEYPWPVLFPPNWSFVEIYGSQYQPLLGKNIKPGEVPPGFIKDLSIDVKETLERIPDWSLNDLIEKEEA